MARLYVFADEAWNFDFTLNQGASHWFILGSITSEVTGAAVLVALIGKRPRAPGCAASGRRKTVPAEGSGVRGLVARAP